MKRRVPSSLFFPIDKCDSPAQSVALLGFTPAGSSPLVKIWGWVPSYSLVTWPWTSYLFCVSISWAKNGHDDTYHLE